MIIPLPQISMLEKRSMDFGCELFSGRTSPPGEENYALVLRNTNIEIWGEGVVRYSAENVISNLVANFFPPPVGLYICHMMTLCN